MISISCHAILLDHSYVPSLASSFGMYLYPFISRLTWLWAKAWQNFLICDLMYLLHLEVRFNNPEQVEADCPLEEKTLYIPHMHLVDLCKC